MPQIEHDELAIWAYREKFKGWRLRPTENRTTEADPPKKPISGMACFLLGVCLIWGAAMAYSIYLAWNR